jgi:hypothetical protein
VRGSVVEESVRRARTVARTRIVDHVPEKTADHAKNAEKTLLCALRALRGFF